MTGKMFSVVTPILPFCIIVFVLLFSVCFYNYKYYANLNKIAKIFL
ncbi:hypothetical protein HMPREF9296_1698 [Prevotella disiens FB035-09AN]|uniref:Uncharacterized protein n=1 Tax=Prevotella disiens FB035-09AN TaxID=866771 RepID=E1KSN7_9BACT|nr:hypothetical protein HMPREF9296_1698 [Prevotella disiens FB035-09AN]